jgi:membrane protease YdiL (CAAX protease family)
MNKETNRTKQDEILQFGFWRTIGMFVWPAAWYTILIYVVGRQLIPHGETAPTWLFLLIIVLGTGAELTVGLWLLHREGYSITLRSLRYRIRLHWPHSLKSWLMAIVVLVVAMGLSMAIGPINRSLASVPGFVPPEWWPAISNPIAAVHSAADVFPDINLRNNYGFLILFFLIGLVFNVFGEEIYYRGYLLPHMRGFFGKWDWIVNGILFMLKHAYQRWLYPGLAIAGLSFAFAAGPLGSLPLAMAFHWIGNFLLPIVLLIKATLGA